MTIPTELILPGLAALLVAFAAGAGSGTFLGKLWAKAKAWDAHLAAQIKAEEAKVQATLVKPVGEVKAAGEIVAEEVRRFLLSIDARAKADAAAKTTLAAAPPSSTPLATLAPSNPAGQS